MKKTILKKYYQPTPKSWRKIGDAILFIGTSMTGYAIFNESQTFTLVSLVLTILGKAVTNFFTEVEESK